MPLGEPTEEERVAICEWLTANGINPKAVPLQCLLTISNGTIHFEEYVLTDDGSRQVDPTDTNRAWARPATAACRVQPPSWLRIPEGPA